MERVAFLLESTGERVGALLNPATLVVRRTAGLRPARAGTGPVGGPWRGDDPLLYTGGGVTELTLDLLFDVSVAGSTLRADDVRALTGPLWRMAETPRPLPGQARPRPPLVTFVWGLAWAMPGLVTALAERLESFTDGGVPRRSWLRMQLVRVPDAAAQPPPEAPAPPPLDELLPPTADPGMGPAIPDAALAEDVPTHELVGAPASEAEPPPGVGERLDEVAARYYGNPAYWRLLAALNGLADPLRVPAGTLLRLPPLSALLGGAGGSQ